MLKISCISTTFSNIAFLSNAAESWNILTHRKGYYVLVASDILTLRGEFFCELRIIHRARNFHHRTRKIYCVARPLDFYDSTIQFWILIPRQSLRIQAIAIVPILVRKVSPYFSDHGISGDAARGGYSEAISAAFRGRRCTLAAALPKTKEVGRKANLFLLRIPSCGEGRPRMGWLTTLM